MKRAIVGAVWCVVLYFLACIIIGGIAGFIATAGVQPGEDPTVIGSKASQNVVERSRFLIGFGAAAVSALGAYFQVLPGTRGGNRPAA